MRCIESGGGKMNIIGFIASVLMVIKSTFALFLKKKKYRSWGFMFCWESEKS